MLETMEAFVSTHNSYSLSLVLRSVNQSSDKEIATAAAAHTPGAKEEKKKTQRDSSWLSPPPLPLLWLQPSSLPSKPTPVSVSEALGRWKGICNAPPLTVNWAVLLGEVYWPCLRFKRTSQLFVGRSCGWLQGDLNTCRLHGMTDKEKR